LPPSKEQYAVLKDLPVKDTHKPKAHELSSMLGDHSIAPDRAQMGEPLADLDVVEVPIGQTADRSYNEQLQHDKWPQPETSGTMLVPPESNLNGVSIEDGALEFALEAEYDDDLQDVDGGVSARPTEYPPNLSQHYDAVSPDDLGAEFLSRAAQSPRAEDERTDPWDFIGAIDPGVDSTAVVSERDFEVPEMPNEEQPEAVSEPGSIQIDVDVPSEVWDVPLDDRRH
jgi:hypothetical protein